MKTVEITQNDDGSFTVNLDADEGMEAQMGGEAGMAEANEPAGESFQTIDEALEAARAMFDSADSAAPMMDGEEEFVSGFKNANGVNGGY